MANYFSNLSSTSTQSRFLSNKDKDSSQLSSTTVVATTTGSSPSPSRKGSSMREKSPTASSAGLPTLSVHPLRSTWVFWFRQQRAPGNKITNYEEGIKKISSFASVESFWSLWTHLHPPSALLPTTDYLLFHQGVRRPVWEDPLNLPGGKWILRLRKGVADRIWEDLVLALIGDQFAGVAPTHEDEWPEICGCTISVRQNEDILSVWNRIDEPKLRERIRDRIRAVLHLPQSTIMEYKSNNDSMADNSSFRNSIIDRTPLS
ncbi:translation initiation factor eIF 4e-like domain-containing protein [Russula earlei]|uniref:Translation initiation factor eIF 4e-like domain-containing protein n=1 Tax=Russula earlei TaxID=71964 RepID=A0ACC0TX34_9AGAM|nr:translation initiation factor eIF 4e-like domain-containing protein [Russula earlei]